MQLKPIKPKTIMILGLIGIMGALITIISDFILIGKPTDAYSFLKLGTGTMIGFPEWRITVGTFLGVVALPIQIAGLVVIYYGLKPGGKKLSLLVFIIAAHALVMGVAFHVSYAFIGSGWRLFNEIGVDNQLAAELMKKFDFYWRVIIIIMLTELALCSLGYVLMILKRKTLYPKWMAILNPLCIYIFMFPFVFTLPAPFGGYIASAYLNLSTMVFFVLSTTAVYNEAKRYPPPL